VLADIVAAPAVKRSQPKRLRVFHLVSVTSARDIQEALTVIARPAAR
jgi:hypothetical protein